MKQPNIDEFLKFAEKSGIQFSPYQKKLAEALIDYRVKHFSGGRGSGRTSVVTTVKSYFKDKYPLDITSREI